MKYLKTFTEIKESEQFKNTFSEDSLDESFFRLPSNIIGNDLYLAAKNLNNFYDSANNGNDIDPGVLDSIIKKLNMIKKAAKKFNSAEEVKGTVFESLDEAVQVDTSRYERSHGKKPRGKGRGAWAFYFDRTGGDAMFTPSAMTYADAVNWAKKQAKEAGKSVVYVGESETTNESFDVSGISRQDLREILNLLDANDISYDFDGREEILDFDLTELGKKDQDQLKKLGLTESKLNEESGPLKLKGIKINKRGPITFMLEISFLSNDNDVVTSYLTAGTQEEAKELKNKIEKAFNAEKIFSPSGIGYYAYVGESETP